LTENIIDLIIEQIDKEVFNRYKLYEDLLEECRYEDDIENSEGD
jgi:hypothetical protein